MSWAYFEATEAGHIVVTESNCIPNYSRVKCEAMCRQLKFCPK